MQDDVTGDLVTIRPSVTAGRLRPQQRRFHHHLLLVLTSFLVLAIVSACGSAVSNPFGEEEPTPEPTSAPAAATPPPAAAAAAAAQPTPTFTPFWAKNFRITDMWSGPTEAAGTVSFGKTSQQFCSFQVVQQPNGPRVYVFNPYSQNYLWIDGDAIGPVGPPEQRTGPPPPGQNCADAVYTR